MRHQLRVPVAQRSLLDTKHSADPEKQEIADYILHYWPIPFRGEFVRAVLSYSGASWEEVDFEEIAAQRARAAREQWVPHMGPPVLTDTRNGAHISQMPAVLACLAEKHALLPEDLVLRAMCHKVTNDANDVLNEMTRHNGAQMSTVATWADYRPRLGRWMEIFEETVRRHGLQADAGHFLGTDKASLADLVVATLCGVMTTKLPVLRSSLDEKAPSVAALVDRVASLPSQSNLRKQGEQNFGDVWCSGQIEASLRSVLAAKAALDQRWLAEWFPQSLGPVWARWLPDRLRQPMYHFFIAPGPGRHRVSGQRL